MHSKKAIVIGAGIVGLATARALALKGFSVIIMERSDKAIGASIRNFGMVWPIGQPNGNLYERALRSKTIWKEISDSTGLWYDECGSLHLAYHEDEWQVLQELNELFRINGRPVELMNNKDIRTEFNNINQRNLIGGLYSATEMIVDPREAIQITAEYLQEFLQVQFIWGEAITAIETGKVVTGKKIYEADFIFLCSGADFETLFPEIFQSLSITKCKLQMMRFAPDKTDWKIGTSVCGGLSLIHYNSFKSAPSLNKLKERYEQQMAEYLKWGIHVMVSQNGKGELTVGDSHEYGLTFEPFDKVFINEMIIDYLKQFLLCDDLRLIQTWNGIYPKMTDGQTEIMINPQKDVYILNGLGGAGMTLSFGLAEEVIEKIID